MAQKTIKAGSTDQFCTIYAVDSTTGVGVDIDHATAGLALWYWRVGATKTAITPAALATLDAAHDDGGVEPVDDGTTRLDLPDAAVAAGVKSVEVGGTATGVIIIGCTIELVAYDPQDTIRLGLTALPAAAADGVGGLPISDAGGLDLDAILADTNELQGDWVNAGRLDAILDIIAADTTTDIPALIGTPVALDSGAATLAGMLTKMADDNGGADFDAGTDSLQEIRDNMAGADAAAIADAVWDEAATGHTDAGKAGAQMWTDVDAILADTDVIGTPVALDSGAATVAGMLIKMADDNGGADFDAGTDSLTEMHDGLASASDINSAVEAGAVGTAVAAIQAVTDVIPDAGALTTIDAAVAAIQAVTDVLPDAGALTTIDTAVAAIQAVTDVIPDAGALTTIDTAVAAIQAVTDVIPDAGALTTIDTAVAAIQAVTDVIPDAGALTDLLADIASILADTGTDGVVLKAAGLAADAVDEIVDEVVEGTTTFRQAFRLLLAALVGDTEDNGLSFRDLADSKDRFTVTVDEDANRNVTIVDAT